MLMVQDYTITGCSTEYNIDDITIVKKEVDK